MHADKMFDYLNDVGGEIVIGEIPKPPHEFESAIDKTLASGYLDDTLTVTDADGVAQVLPVLDSEPISHLVEGLEAVGGSANVFVHTSAGVVALSVVEYKPNEEE